MARAIAYLVGVVDRLSEKSNITQSGTFAHIVDKNKAIDYDGWNIPEVKCWIPCPKIEED